LCDCLNGTAGGIFLALGIKGYWDYRGWTAFLILRETLARAGWARRLAKFSWRALVSPDIFTHRLNGRHPAA